MKALAFHRGEPSYCGTRDSDRRNAVAFCAHTGADLQRRDDRAVYAAAVVGDDKGRAAASAVLGCVGALSCKCMSDEAGFVLASCAGRAATHESRHLSV